MTPGSCAIKAGICKTKNYVVNDIQANQIVSQKNGHHFADDNYKYTLSNKHCEKNIYLPKSIFDGPIDNKSALAQIVAWWWTGDRYLPEPMLA